MKYAGLILVAALGWAGTASAQQARQVSGFHSISNEASFAVHIKINGTESLQIVGANADEAARIETKVDGDELVIRWRQGSVPFRLGRRIDVYVTAKSLTSLANSGSGSLELDGSLTGHHMDVASSGSGSIAAAIDGGELGVTMSGSGRVRLTGKTGSMEINMSGSGGLFADGLVSDVARVVLSGSGTARIHVDKILSANIDGSGGVHYSGNGVVSSVSRSGSGRVRRV